MIDWDTPEEDLLHENAAGCLVGLAVGDALGGPVESLSNSEIAEQYGTLVEMVGGGRLHLKPGETTDDTGQVITLSESIIACSGFVPEDFSARLGIWYENRPRGVGNHTARVMELITTGEDWEKAALQTQIDKPESAGNGSLMRCAPVALLDHASSALLIDDSRLSSRVTHPHSQCQWSCVLTNLVIADLLDGSTPVKAVDNALSICAQRDDVNHEVLERVRMASMHGSLAHLKPTGYVLDTLECSLWCLLHTDDFETAVVRAVNMGGDSDTIGAVTGALTGAAYGLGSIPDKWIDFIGEAGFLQDLSASLVSMP
jgi:ADP-ribosyl-[dinitrogen reductase] hydrolase